jgi:hypothetical protein
MFWEFKYKHLGDYAIMATLIVMILACALAASILIVALVQFGRMSFRHYETNHRKARELLQKGQLDRAETKIGSALRNIGWDYTGLLEARGAKRLIGIEGTRTFWHQTAIRLKILPPDTIEWAVRGLMLLGEIYEKQEQSGKAYNLYDDLFGYIAASGDNLHRIDRTRAEAELHNRQCAIDLDQDSLFSAVKRHSAYLLSSMYLAKLENNEIEFKARYPYKGDDRMVEILNRMDRDQDKQALIDIINRGMNAEMGRINISRADRAINLLLTGRKSATSKTHEAARIMLQSVIEKAIEKDKEEEGDEPLEKEDKDVILL